jgi:hypothetical protein
MHALLQARSEPNQGKLCANKYKDSIQIELSEL